MGRKRKSPEMRVEKVPEDLRVKLLVAWEARQAADRERERTEAEVVAVIERALAEGASLRDVAAVLGVPHTNVHHLVKPYERPKLSAVE